jgi:hypothetical protein
MSLCGIAYFGAIRSAGLLQFLGWQEPVGERPPSELKVGQLPPNSKKPSCGKVRVFIKHRQQGAWPW